MTIDSESLFDFLLACKLLELDGSQVRFRSDWLASALMGQRSDDSGTGSMLSGVWGDKAVIGITGNIAVGKSTVLTFLSRLGAAVVDADRVVHRLREPGAPGYRAIVAWLGEAILLADGRLDVAQLSARAFSSPEFLKKLEAVFRPLVVEEVARWAQASDRRVVVVEAIKLLEGDLRQKVDQVWVVDASRERQVARLVNARGMTIEQAENRIDAQGTQLEKLAQADVVIANDGDLVATQRQVLDAWEVVLEALHVVGWLTPELLAQYFAVQAAHHSSLRVDYETLMALMGAIATELEQSGNLTRAAAIGVIERVVG